MSAIAFVVATIVAVFVVYLTSRKMLFRESDKQTIDFAGKVTVSIATLHSLVIALVFASEALAYHQLSFESAIETNAVADVFYDTNSYDSHSTEEIRTALKKYLKIAATTEWDRLGNGEGLQSDGWAAWDEAYSGALDLVPQNPRQEALRYNILSKMHLISEKRNLREHQAKSSLDGLFWVAAFGGALFVAVGFYPFPPTRGNLILLSTYAVYTGFIFYAIYTMSNPYNGLIAVVPLPYEQLLVEIGG